MVQSASLAEKKVVLEKICGEVIDKFVLHQRTIDEVKKRQGYEDWLRICNPVTTDGHFKCRSSTCDKTFKFNGKKRVDHEKSHGLHNVRDLETREKNDSQDDVYNYQCSLLEYGMIWLNCNDAIAEGDGLRVYRSWLFMLPYLKNDGAPSRKYALEALHLIMQNNVLLSPRDAHRLIWDRFHKQKEGKGGNIPLDLALEHFNNQIKTIIRKLGPNATNKNALDRITKALTINKSLMDNFDSRCNVIKRSGKHVRKSATKDLEKVVNELTSKKAMYATPGRRYEIFKNFPRTLLSGFDIHAFYQWIEDHKQTIFLKKTAR